MAETSFNYLTSTKGVLTIQKIPGVSFNIQNFQIPSMSIGEAMFSTPRVNLPLPGDKIDWEDLSVEFLIDEDMTNWKTMYDWMVDIAPTENCSQYNSDNLSDGVVQILSSKNNIVRTLKFVDMWPTALNAVDLTVEDAETTYKKCSVTFRYGFYTVT